MNFFERQAHARSRTRWLVFMFALGVGATIAAGYIGIRGLLVFAGSHATDRMTDYEKLHYYLDDFSHFYEDPIFFWVAGFSTALILIGSLVQIARISGGGSKVSEMMGARRVSPTTKEPLERRLLNVISEMALASGTKVPEVFVMDSEMGINAFAAGFSPTDASITVTRGCLVQLSRDELQGVIGHEFSHIYNGDMHLNMRLIGILAGLLLLAKIGMTILRNLPAGRSSRDRDGGVAFLFAFGLIMTAVGFFGFMCGRLIKAAVSRERERLADASSVQFTRNPLGLGGALLKIRACEQGSHVAHAHTEEVSHMLFADGISLSLFSLLDTHPPIEERLAAIDPGLVNEKVALKPQTGLEAERSGAAPAPTLAGTAAIGAASGFAGAAVAVAAVAAATSAPAVRATVATVGRPSTRNFDDAREFLARLPAVLKSATEDEVGARAVVYSIFLEDVGSGTGIRQKQLDALKAGGEGEPVGLIGPVAVALAGLGEAAHLSLLSLCLPVLRELPVTMQGLFLRNIDALIRADGKVDLREFALQTVLVRRLNPQRPQNEIRHRDLAAIGGELSLALSLLAFAGESSVEAARPAFQLAASELGAQLTLAGAADCVPEKLNAAFEELRLTSPALKERIMHAFATCVLADGKVSAREWEVLRAVSDSIDCPLPPLVASAG